MSPYPSSLFSSCPRCIVYLQYGLASVQGAADLLTLLMSVPLSVTILREIGRKRRMQMGEAPLRQQMTHEPGGAG